MVEISHEHQESDSAKSMAVRGAMLQCAVLLAIVAMTANADLLDFMGNNPPGSNSQEDGNKYPPVLPMFMTQEPPSGQMNDAMGSDIAPMDGQHGGGGGQGSGWGEGGGGNMGGSGASAPAPFPEGPPFFPMFDSAASPAGDGGRDKPFFMNGRRLLSA